VREPDAQLGYLYGGWLTMGMVLSLPLVAAGLALLWWAVRSRPTPVVAETEPARRPSGEAVSGSAQHIRQSTSSDRNPN
jgi:phosphatidylglycerol---prolipoprotein diacylglyceryl transferase